MPIFLCLFYLLCLCSCESQEGKIHTYRLAKLPPSTAKKAPPPAVEPPSHPSHWQALTPGFMRQALFKLKEHSQENWELSLSFLAKDSGSEQANIHRWQKQIGAPPSLAPPSSYQHFPFGKAKIYTFEYEAKSLWIAAFYKEEGSYYIKVMGQQSLVKQEKQQVEFFIKNLKKWPH